MVLVLGQGHSDDHPYILQICTVASLSSPLRGPSVCSSLSRPHEVFTRKVTQKKETAEPKWLEPKWLRSLLVVGGGGCGADRVYMENLCRWTMTMQLIRVAERLGASSWRPRHPFPALMAGVNPGRVPVDTALQRRLMSSSLP